MEKTKKENLIYNGRVVKLYVDDVTCPNGQETKREIIKHNGGAGILAIDNNNNVLLVKQFRYAYKETIYEIPAGKLEKGENPYDAAIRELEEETGYKTDKLTHLGDIYPSVGYTNEIIHIYLANNLLPSIQHLDFDESLDVIKMPFDEFVHKIKTNEIKDAKTIAALNFYFLSKLNNK